MACGVAHADQGVSVYAWAEPTVAGLSARVVRANGAAQAPALRLVQRRGTHTLALDEDLQADAALFAALADMLGGRLVDLVDARGTRCLQLRLPLADSEHRSA